MSITRNAAAYRHRWSASKRVVQMRPHLWRELAPQLEGKRILEIGAGLRPTAPVKGSHFAEVSPEALAVLERWGGKTLTTVDHRLDLEDASLDAVFAFEVLEHVEADEALLGEIARVLRPGGLFVFSVPMRMKYWSRLDESAAHVRRYEPDELMGKLSRANLRPERLEPRFGHPNRFSDLLAVSLLKLAPRITNGLLQRVAFPVQTAVQRRFGKMRWRKPSAPLPKEASGVCLVASRG